MTPWLRLLRPKQWIKNAFVFAPLLFSGQFTRPEGWVMTTVAALAFLCVSCVVYIANDIRDAEEDRRHPVKRLRPLASGEIGIFPAVLLACGLAAAGLFLLAALPSACTAVALLYAGLNLVYTLWLKRVAIVDIFFVAFCYVLRVLMGGYALDVTLSPWIILTTFLLALFLGFAKRYHEMGFEEYAASKPNLRAYNRKLLDRLVMLSGGAALITYAIYAAEVAQKIGRVELVYTVGFVAFGFFRYLQSIYVYGKGGEPENIFFEDRLQLLNAALWLLVTLWILF